MKQRPLIFLLFFSFLGSAIIAKAQEPALAKNHPHHSDVNQRLQELDRRIRNKEENREMSKRLAYNLNHHAQQIQQKGRKIASRHPIHSKKTEQNHLNHQRHQETRKTQHS